MSIFEKYLTVQYMVDLENKTSHDIGGKAEMVQSDTVG